MGQGTSLRLLELKTFKKLINRHISDVLINNPLHPNQYVDRDGTILINPD